MFAQNSGINIKSEEQHRFTLHLNGAAQNETPGSEVYVKYLAAATYRVKIVFEDQNLGTTIQDIYLSPDKTSCFLLKYSNTPNLSDDKQLFALKFDNCEKSNILSKDYIAYFDKKEKDKVFINNIYNSLAGERNIILTTNGGLETVYNDGASVTVTKKEETVSSGLTGLGCNQPVDYLQLRDVCMIIGLESTDLERINTIKEMLESNCFSSKQLEQILLKVDSDNSKAEIIRVAKPYIYNPTDFKIVFNQIRNVNLRNELIAELMR